MYSAKVIADSIGPAKVRITTLELTYPRLVHSELMTHRVFSRNSASSRAIPVEKMLKRIEEDPVIPVYWGKNQKGMQATEELSALEQADALAEWLAARDNAVATVRRLQAIGVHKQLANRVTEPWMWITVLVTATEWRNFFHLRVHKDAQPEIKRIAEMAYAVRRDSKPQQLGLLEWHLPLVPDKEDLLWQGYALNDIVKVSTGRCARVSYLTHDGQRSPSADIGLHDSLLSDGHLSPFEHQAQALFNDRAWSGNFRGWHQYRKSIPNENDYLGSDTELEFDETA